MKQKGFQFKKEPDLIFSNKQETVPDYFYEHLWPYPQLINNSPVGPDEALKWYMQYKRDEVVQTHKVDILNIPYQDSPKARCIRVKTKAKFQCVRCWKVWTSNHVWMNFDMVNMMVTRFFGQRCRNCVGSYMLPSPFPFSFNGDFRSATWNEVVEKALDRLLFVICPWSRPALKRSQDFRPTPPHEESMCQKCQMLGRNCSKRPRTVFRHRGL